MPVNFPAWNLYLTVATQFGMDFHVDVVAVMAKMGIKRPELMLQKLSIIYQCHLDNRESKA
jgi:hypothetical protein